MAFKLTKAEAKTKADHVAALEAHAAELEKVIAAFNDTKTEAWKAVNEAVENYNEALEEAREFIEDIVSSRREEWDDKSEKWQEGERGLSASVWVEEWESADLEDISLDEPDDVDFSEPDHRDTIESLSDEMDS